MLTVKIVSEMEYLIRRLNPDPHQPSDTAAVVHAVYSRTFPMSRTAGSAIVHLSAVAAPTLAK